MTKVYHSDGKTIKINEDYCIGCGACVDMCPTGVLDVVKGVNTAEYVDNCCKCRECERVCPVDAIKVD